MFRFFVAAALLLSACSENDFKTLNDPGNEPVPDIEVDPGYLNFAMLTSGEEETQVFTVTNVGGAPLQVSDLFIEGSDAFTILSGSVEFSLDIDESKEIAVLFTPLQVDNTARAVVASDDPDEPEAYVDLQGAGAVPELLISPDPYDFGPQSLPCASTKSLTFENIGSEPLTIESTSYKDSSGMMALLDPNLWPLTLNENDSTTVDITFTPSLVGLFDGSLSVNSNDPRGIVTALQSGEGVYSATATEDFVVPTNPPVDILFAVDQSCSMDTVTVPLGNAFSQFISSINAVTSGWRIGVVTNDNGCFNYNWLAAGTPNYDTYFNNAVNMGGCVGGSPSCDTEALLKLTNTALSKTGANQCNKNFLRAGALLHVIVVSDEIDQSPQGWASYRNSFQSYVSSPALLKVSAIVDITNSCGDGTGAGGYSDIAYDTGGLVLDVCNSNWSQKTADLAMASLQGIGQYALNEPADPNSLTVMVNGQKTANFTYDPATNTVVIDDPLDGGDTVTIDYGVLGSCP